jgi:hypothetical protein
VQRCNIYIHVYYEKVIRICCVRMCACFEKLTRSSKVFFIMYIASYVKELMQNCLCDCLQNNGRSFYLLMRSTSSNCIFSVYVNVHVNTHGRTRHMHKFLDYSTKFWGFYIQVIHIYIYIYIYMIIYIYICIYIYI